MYKALLWEDGGWGEGGKATFCDRRKGNQHCKHPIIQDYIKKNLNLLH